MNRILRSAVVATLAATVFFTARPASTQILPLAATAPASVSARSKELSTLFADIWEDNLKHNPEYASTLGDKRFNDQLSDYSAAAVNASLERGRKFIERLSLIDTTGLSDQEQLSADLMLRSLTEAQEAARFKEWEMPVDQMNGFHLSFSHLLEGLTFDSVKDYDDYIARLKKMPVAFSQVMTNMDLGMDEGRMPPRYILELALTQTQSIATSTAKDSLFSDPLKKFPKSITPPSRPASPPISSKPSRPMSSQPINASRSSYRPLTSPKAVKTPARGRSLTATPTTPSASAAAPRSTSPPPRFTSSASTK